MKGNFQARFWNSGGRGDSPTDCSKLSEVAMAGEHYLDITTMLALAMLSLTCIGDACTYSVLTRCGTGYRAPQRA